MTTDVNLNTSKQSEKRQKKASLFAMKTSVGNCGALKKEANQPILLSVDTQAAEGCALVVICFLSLAGNLFFWLVILRYRSLRSMVNILLLSIAFADFLEAAINMTISTHSVTLGRVSFDCAICSFMAYMTTVTDTVSITSLCALSINRYVRICWQPWYRNIYNKSYIGLHVLAIWVLACLWASMPLLGFGKYAYTQGMFYCFMDTFNNQVLRTTGIAAFITMMLLVIYCYITIFYKLSKIKQSSGPITSVASPTQQTNMQPKPLQRQQTGGRTIIGSQLTKRLSAIEEITDSNVTNELCSLTRSSARDDHVHESSHKQDSTVSLHVSTIITPTMTEESDKSDKAEKDGNGDHTLEQQHGVKQSSEVFPKSSAESDEWKRYNYEKCFTQSLLLATFAYWLMFLPTFHVTVLNKTSEISSAMKVFFLLLGYLNNMIKPMLFGWGNSKIRTGYKLFFKDLVKCMQCKIRIQVEPG